MFCIQLPSDQTKVHGEPGIIVWSFVHRPSTESTAIFPLVLPQSYVVMQTGAVKLFAEQHMNLYISSVYPGFRFVRQVTIEEYEDHMRLTINVFS